MAAGKRSGKRPAKQRDPEEALLHVLQHPLRKRLQRRGSVEHFYEATGLVDEVPWGRAALGITGEGKR
jgi:hypothetical protein